jgi:hypothetical protein
VHYKAELFSRATIHGIVLFIGWGVLVDISLIFARYLKTYPHYLKIHSLLSWLTVISTLVMEALMMVKILFDKFRIIEKTIYPQVM